MVILAIDPRFVGNGRTGQELQKLIAEIASVLELRRQHRRRIVCPVFVIGDLSTVWLYADIYEYEVPLVREGQKVTIALSYYPAETFSGTITYIYPYLDTQTRTNKVRLEFANPQGKLKPGR